MSNSGPVVWGCRLIKSEWEIDCMRQACEIGGDAWRRAFEDLRPGIAAATVQKNVLRYYLEGGADLTSEPPTVLGATGPDRTFQNGDVLYIDGGCNYSGYKMDYARRAVFGPPSARQQAEHDGMWGILNEIIERMKPGVSVRELFEYSQSRLAQHPEWRNYSDHPSKRIGHGIGLENEPPSISGTDDTVLAGRDGADTGAEDRERGRSAQSRRARRHPSFWLRSFVGGIGMEAPCRQLTGAGIDEDQAAQREGHSRGLSNAGGDRSAGRAGISP